MAKAAFPKLLIFFALVISGCSIDVAQPAASTPSAEADQISPPLPVGTDNAALTGKLIYTSVPVGQVTPISIQVLDLTTDEVKTIFTTTGDAWVFYISVSPDGKQLVMSYAPPSEGVTLPSRALYTMPLDGSTQPKLLFKPPTSEDHYIHAEWSPDGKYIYYVHYNNLERQQAGYFYPAYDLLRMEYPDGQPEMIAEKAFWPRVSADSTKIAYASLDPDTGFNELFIADADGGNAQKLTLAGPYIPNIIDAPIFSPDGESVLFSAPPPPQAYKPNWFDILMGVTIAKAHPIPSDWWSVPLNGGEVTRLTQIQTPNLFASISPDKEHLASVSGEGLFVMDWDGSNLTQLLSNPGVSGTLSWLP